MDSEQSINIHQFSREISGVEVVRYSAEDVVSWILVNQTAKEAMVDAALRQAEEAGLICGINRDHAKIIVTFEKRIHSKPSGASALFLCSPTGRQVSIGTTACGEQL